MLRGYRSLIRKVDQAVPGYQRRLIASGLLHEHGGARGVANVTDDGLRLFENFTDAFHEVVREWWPTDIVEHPAIVDDPFINQFALRISATFDGFSWPDGRHLVQDFNLAHLDWLRSTVEQSGTASAVMSASGIYRPVAGTQPLIRDQFIFPFLAFHLVTPQPSETSTWPIMIAIIERLAHLVGIPLLLTEPPPPQGYARRCLSALLPGPNGELEPWILAYRLGAPFEEYLGLPGAEIFEIGISGRLLALFANLQNGGAAQFGSRVMPAQVLWVESGAPLAEANLEGLRARAIPAARIPSQSLAPILLEDSGARYASLHEGYSTMRASAGQSVHSLLEGEDEALRQATQVLLHQVVTEQLASKAAHLRSSGSVIIRYHDSDMVGRIF